MSLTLTQITVPPILRALNNLHAVLGKGAAHCEANKIDHATLVQFRLYPDMRPLSFQVQVACDMSKGCVARLSGLEMPSYEDTETSFAELQQRIEKTVALVEGVSSALIDNAESKAIVLKTPRGELNFVGTSYVQGFVLPNVYFHSATAYNILRHNGVALGKMDFLGKP